ncbi:MAG TPA: excinuclease ABC subunit UvrA [Anaeromyxobacteraceae bacterium]|nr:excinuclease ABC subunit UvrA [Anaeromyxobacteraceae bacterium]
MSEPDFISIRGAREHNLKSVDLEIPKKKLVVFTGVSGSGKSSLAFDTLYAEGQRRYVESLSSYARQFLGQMEKPKYDTLRGLSPTISIEQKAASNNPRSTVGTITEVHDYLRVLYAAIGVQHCPVCDRPVGKQTAQQIVDAILALPEGSRVLLLAPIVQNRKGEYRDLFQDLAKRGFARVRVDGMIHALEERLALDKKLKHDIELVVDRLVVKPGIRQRLGDSVETALREGKGTLIVADADKEQKVGPGIDPEAYKRYDRFFSELNACPYDNLSFAELAPQQFSFNNPVGSCPDCQGLGTRPEMDPDIIVPDGSLSIRDGAVEPWASGMDRGEGWTFEFVEHLSRSLGIDLDVPWRELSKAHRDVILFGNEGGRARIEWEGVVNQLLRRFKQTGSEMMRRHYMRYFSDKPCQTCRGERLRPESRAVRIRGVGIVELSRKTIIEAHRWISTLGLEGNEARIADEVVKEIRNRLKFLLDVGLGYLTLDRAGPSLSGGESQRIRLASQMGSELTGVIYILDEPSIGLHQRDNGKLLATLKRLRDVGNSVIVVEHDEETMEDADWIVDFGPGAGEHGGEIVGEGTPAQIQDLPRSITGAYLSGRREIEVPERRRATTRGGITVVGATENNLKDVTVRFPLGVFTAVTGVSGAGKSTLVNAILRPALSRALNGAREAPGRHRDLLGVDAVDKIIDINQQPIGRTPRSNPATYTKVFDFVRDVFAQTPEARSLGFQPGRFSFNVKGGRCEACQGDGMKLVEMHFLADVLVPCEVCGGKRFNEATLRVRFKDKNVADVLDLSVSEAASLFQNHKEIVRILRTLEDVGMGYVKLGQPSPTLSGGEAQRIKLSRELARVGTGRTVYILDEPTTGLHFEDVKRLLVVLDRLVEAGNTVIVIEHNLDVVKCADWIVDLGPEGGDEGGRVIAEGTPEEVARVKASYTGQHLARTLARHRERRAG